METRTRNFYAAVGVTPEQIDTEVEKLSIPERDGFHPSHYVHGSDNSFFVTEIGIGNVYNVGSFERAVAVASALEAGEAVPPLLTEQDIKNNMKHLPPLPKPSKKKSKTTTISKNKKTEKRATRA